MNENLTPDEQVKVAAIREELARLNMKVAELNTTLALIYQNAAARVFSGPGHASVVVPPWFERRQ